MEQKNFDYLIGRTYEFWVGNSGQKKFKLEFTITKIGKPFLCDVAWQRIESDYAGEYPMMDYDCYQLDTTYKENGELCCYEVQGTKVPVNLGGEIRVYANGEIELRFDTSWGCKVKL